MKILKILKILIFPIDYVYKYAIAITNIKTNCVIGYMSIDFANNEHIDIEQVKHCLKDKKLKIEALLNL